MVPARGSVALLAAFLASTITFPALAAPRASKSSSGAAARAIREDDLLRMEWVADPRIAPDGRRVAFTRVSVDTVTDEYRTSIWVIDANGGEPRPLTAGPRDAQPRWSPDGRTLAFTRAAEGKPAQIHLLPMAGGEATPLTRLMGGASQPVWSPDGTRILFASSTNPKLDDDSTRTKPKHDPGRVVVRPVFRINNAGFIDREHPSHLWVVSATGGKPRQLTTGDF
jgi:dipeptidyl aminopeptidase/acylaminoacyl peptidase